VDAVHAKGSYIFLQLWALGRAALPEVLETEGYPYVSSSDVALSEQPIPPRPLTIEGEPTFLWYWHTISLAFSRE
jgi:NADPH2 dehydrogenase